MLATAVEARLTFLMNLEDHLGDIIRKARAMSGVSSDAAASAAGLTGAELTALEASGEAGKNINVAALAPLIGLNTGRLEGIAQGWRPEQRDLSLWRELHQISTTEDGNTVHCYLVWDEVTREAALFDTGWDAAPVLQRIAENQLQLKHVFITHTHHDHMAGLAKIREAFPAIHLHTDAKGALPQHKNRRNDCLHLGSLRITNRETPGHSEDGVTYIVGNWSEDAPHVAFVGDAIFAGSIGNGNGAWELARQKVREQILTLPADTLICSGHGPVTTVGEEQAHNPFF